MSQLEQNTAALQALLNAANALPSAGVPLPSLTSPAAAGDVAAGKEFIDENGAKQTGTLADLSAATF